MNDPRVNYQRDTEGSRNQILAMLQLAEDWITAKQALGLCTETGPWSEDLQQLVREGLVESQDPVWEMGNDTLVRIAP